MRASTTRLRLFLHDRDGAPIVSSGASPVTKVVDTKRRAMHTDADLAIRMVNEDVELSTIQGH